MKQTTNERERRRWMYGPLPESERRFRNHERRLREDAADDDRLPDDAPERAAFEKPFRRETEAA